VFTALLDTCVLVPSLQRDFLLSLAVEGLYRPVWSSAVLTELEYVEVRKLIRLGLNAEQATRRAARLIGVMRHSFNDAEVEGWEPLEGTYGLPDPDDEHLVAAAVVAGAGVIVTHNERDFPKNKLPTGVQTVSPQEFAFNTVAVDPVTAQRAVTAYVNRSGRKGPRITEDQMLDLLIKRYDMAEAVSLLSHAR
jgi:predicted nucleic acid-binding protein